MPDSDNPAADSPEPELSSCVTYSSEEDADEPDNVVGDSALRKFEGKGDIEAGNLEQALYVLRWYLESVYRENIHHEASVNVFAPRLTDDGRALDKVNLGHGGKFESPRGYGGIIFCGNKTVPIYVLPSGGEDPTVPVAQNPELDDLFEELFQGLFSITCRRFEGEIDCDEFIAKLISPALPPHQSDTEGWTFEGYIKAVLVLNKGICDTFEQAQAALQDRPSPSRFRSYHIHPLFRALAIVVQTSNYRNMISSSWFDSSDESLSDIGSMVVTLVSTGDDRRLSAPITLDTTLTGVDKVSYTSLTLADAIWLVLELKKREKLATSTVPLQPVVVWNNGLKPQHHGGYSYLTNLPHWFTKTIGWTDGPIVGPSSSWVDLDKYRYPKGMAIHATRTIQRFKLSREIKYVAWRSYIRWQSHAQCWYFWYSSLSPEEREKTNGAEATESR